MRVWSLKQTSGKIHLNNFQTIVFNQFRCKNTQPSKMTQKFVFIKVTHMLENYVRALTGPLFFLPVILRISDRNSRLVRAFSTPYRSTDIQNLSDLVLLQKRGNQHFTCWFNFIKIYGHVDNGNTIKRKENSGILLHQPSFETFGKK